jgi:Trk K+ transport system NAD-binding subunit
MLNALFALLRRFHARRSVLLAVAAGLVVLAGPFAFALEARAAHADVSWHEALYFTFGLFTLQGSRFGYPATPLLRALSFAAPAISASAVLGAFVRLLEERGGPIVFRRFRGHTVIGGLGNLGATIARHELRRGRNFIAVERDAEAPQVADLRAAGGSVLVGDMTSTEVLGRAGSEFAREVFFTASSDIANLDAAFHVRRRVRAARALPPPRVYAHVYDAGLSDAIEHQLRSHRADEADIVTFNSYRFAAKALIALLLRDRLIGSLRVAPGLVLERTRWPGGADRVEEPPRRDHAATLAEDRRRLLAAFRLAAEPAAGAEERFAIVGLGRFGRSVVRELISAVSASASFLILERSAASLEAQITTFSAEERARFEVLVADASRPEAGARIHAFAPRAVIVCTDSDLGNLRVALDLHRRDIKTITRMFDLDASQELARGLEDCGIATVGLAPLFRAAIPILTHERRLRACLNVDFRSTPEVDHLFYLSELAAEERRELAERCVALAELPRAPGAPEPPPDLALVWYRAVERLRRAASRDAAAAAAPARA